MKYQTIVFDLFGTLVPYIGNEEFSMSLSPLADILEVELNRILEFWLTKERYYQAITVYDSTYERVKTFCNAIGIQDQEKIKEVVESRLSIHAKWLMLSTTTISTLEKIKANKNRIGLMSDCSAEVPELWKASLLSEFVEVSIFSCIEKMNKSDIALFDLCCSRMNTPAQDIIYVGDSIVELEQAKKIGMKPVLKKTRKNLQWEGDAIDNLTEILKYLHITH